MRLPVYVSHSFEHADKYARVVEFARDEGVPVTDLSVPVWRQISGGKDKVQNAISERIRWASRVLVLVTSEIHKSPYIEFEVAVAKALGKPIIGVYPNGENEGPIPTFLEGAYYRMVGWRRGALAKALAGEYPPDPRVFDIAEVEERRRIVTALATGVGIVTLLVAGANALNFARLRRDLEARGIAVVDSSESLLGTAAPPAILGAVAGAALFGLVGGEKGIGPGAALGAAIGLGLGMNKYYRTRIEQLGTIAALHFEPVRGPGVTDVSRLL